LKKEKPTYEISKKGFDLKKTIDDCELAGIITLSIEKPLIGNGKESHQTQTIKKEITRTSFDKSLKTACNYRIFPARLPSAKRIISYCLSVLFIMILSGCIQETKDVYPKYGNSPATPTIPTYHFAVIALSNPVKLMQDYQPLIDYLNEKIPGVRFVVEPSLNYANFEQKYKDRIPEFVLPNPWQTIQAVKSGYKVIAMAGESKDFKGIFIVRKDSNITKPEDLKGKSVSYSSPTALATCIMPQYFLDAHGINVDSDIESLYVGTQESSIMNVYMKMTSAGTSWPPSWKDFQKNHPKESSQLKVIWATEPLINNSVMARNDVPVAISEQVRKNLLELNQTAKGRRISANMEITQFFPANDKDYDVVRIYIKNFEQKIRKVETN